MLNFFFQTKRNERNQINNKAQSTLFQNLAIYNELSPVSDFFPYSKLFKSFYFRRAVTSNNRRPRASSSFDCRRSKLKDYDWWTHCLDGKSQPGWKFIRYSVIYIKIVLVEVVLKNKTHVFGKFLPFVYSDHSKWTAVTQIYGSET